MDNEESNKCKNNKSAVQPKKLKSAQKHDVQPKEETFDTNDNKSKKDRSDVSEKGAVDSHEPDVPSENEQEKIDAKKRKHDNSDVFADTAGDSDEPIILKRQTTTDISLRRSARVQQKKKKVKALVKEAKEKYTKKVASPFILAESSITYWPPPGILWLIWSQGEKCSAQSCSFR